MNKGFSKLDNPSHEGLTNAWLTPLNIIHSLGEFDLDPCGFPTHMTAKKIIYLPDDGLSIDWYGRVWMNPPYGKNINLWLDKLKRHGDGIALVFSRTDTQWFHNLNPDGIFFLKGRIRFLTSEFKESTNAGHGSMLVIYGRNNITSVIGSGLCGAFFTNRIVK